MKYGVIVYKVLGWRNAWLYLFNMYTFKLSSPCLAWYVYPGLSLTFFSFYPLLFLCLSLSLSLCFSLSLSLSLSLSHSFSHLSLFTHYCEITFLFPGTLFWNSYNSYKIFKLDLFQLLSCTCISRVWLLTAPMGVDSGGSPHFFKWMYQWGIIPQVYEDLC